MNNFKEALEEKINTSLLNNYGIENYDEYRSGKYVEKITTESIFQKTKNLAKKILRYNEPKAPYLIIKDSIIHEYGSRLQQLWELLNQTDKELVVSLIAYRILGYKKVKLSRNNKEYWAAIESAKSLADSKDTYDPHFMHFILEKFDLAPIGYDIKIYFSEVAIAIDFIIEQYVYKRNGKNLVEAEKGDTVLDIGGCWGDTSLYFAHKVGKNGKVYSFEFIPDNIKLFKLNTSFNPHLLPQIELIPNPVFNSTGEIVYYKDFGPGSRVEFAPFDEQTGTTTTITVDDFVQSNNITKVDFIKMDIEGAEPYALKGAIETIKKFRPKLAIAIYHSLDDFVNIPQWILDLNLGYEIFIGHYTIHSEETVCFAKPRNR
jgi:FkbM family methyltransferase